MEFLTFAFLNHKTLVKNTITFTGNIPGVAGSKILNIGIKGQHGRTVSTEKQ